MSGNTNPGNFANRPTEEVKEIASKVCFFPDVFSVSLSFFDYYLALI